MQALTILTPVYRDIHGHTQAAIKKLRGTVDVRLVTVMGLSCVTQARIAVATKAVQTRMVDDDTPVLWLDSDMVFDVTTIQNQLSALRDLEAHNVKAIAGLALKRNAEELAVFGDETRKSIQHEKWGNVVPVFAGMACLMMPGHEFLRIVDTSPTEYTAEGEPARHIICCPRVKYGQYGARFVSEDFDYCSRIDNGVWCLNAVQYGHVSERVIYPG